MSMIFISRQAKRIPGHPLDMVDNPISRYVYTHMTMTLQLFSLPRAAQEIKLRGPDSEGLVTLHLLL